MRKVSIGKQDYESLIKSGCFYVDKTYFIKEWWESQDDVTLITRPRRFGKTLNMSMLECFFSNKYAGRSDLFEGLSIWDDEKYRQLQGTYPVIFISFAEIKANNFKDTKNDMVSVINDIYKQHSYLLEDDMLTDAERNLFRQLDNYSNNTNVNKDISNETIYRAVKNLAAILYRKFEKKVIILLDEYDTPMQEAYVNGYWNELVSFTRSFFNATFKSNPYMECAVMTGITRVSKESVFSDLNNLKVITVESDEYSGVFGFSEEEVFLALDNFNLSDKKQIVKEWYDGFTFGKQKDIYNPWSIINFLENKKIDTYWADTSSNSLIDHLMKKSVPEIKELMELLLKRESIEVTFDDQIVFNQLDKNKNAIWSLLVASGYLKIDYVEYKGLLLKPWYHISITNLETISMFANMFAGWFENPDARYSDFVKALLNGNIKEMNYYMNKVALATFSYFDTGKNPSGTSEPENLASCYDCKGVANGSSLNDSSNLYAMTRQSSRFYHGFVLGLIVELSDSYEVKSNRESGFGRYDVMIVPQDKSSVAMVLEFKVHEPDEEKTLEETVASSLAQIEEKKYDAELINAGVKKENIRHYGFAFEGKKVLIGTDEQR